jgi:hypothetical protein
VRNPPPRSVTPRYAGGGTEGNPVLNIVRYLAFGVGEVALVTREVLRETEPDRLRRPVVHVA